MMVTHRRKGFCVKKTKNQMTETNLVDPRLIDPASFHLRAQNLKSIRLATAGIMRKVRTNKTFLEMIQTSINPPQEPDFMKILASKRRFLAHSGDPSPRRPVS